MEKFEFQETAVEDLIGQFKTLWKQPQHQIPITLKAPTGSGKTYMTEKLICDLTKQPDWKQDVAFVWITFSDDLAMQSKDKFVDYFTPNLPGRMLTIEDLNQGALRGNDVIFLNWQKLVSESADNRVNRRPKDERLRKESGYYFEDVLELTKAEGREFILIIDESHRNVTAASMRDVINPMNPKIIFKVSATPEEEPSYSDITHNKAGWYEVERQDVIDAGLIKSELICQTEEDLKSQEGEDLDKALLTLAMKKRQALCDDINTFGFDVNPLVIIQLPNDDSSVDSQDMTKEQYVTEFLVSKGVPATRIAKWFTSQKKPVGLEDNNSPYDYLLFKMAAGTGWDCPRAQVLVMFRDIHSETFETQTIGRIVRVPVRGVPGAEIFKNGYIYTNCKRAAVLNAKYDEPGNKPKTFISTSKKGEDFVLDVKLDTEYISRADYGDLGKSWEFQKQLFKTFNEYFGIQQDDTIPILKDKLTAKGLSIIPTLKQQVLVNSKMQNFDQISIEFNAGENTEYEVSLNDVQKWFTSLCVSLLKEQTDEDCKIGNIARSWGSLKSALRLWLKFVFPELDDDGRYRIFIADTERGANSIFRICLTKTLKDYRPILNAQIDERKRKAEEQDTETFVIYKACAFTDDYEVIETKKCLYSPFYLRKEYNGRDNEIAFIKYIDDCASVDWWMKNGDSGKDWLSFRYENEESGKTELFYPDWIIYFKNGDIGLFDTKSGNTATSVETKCKAEALQKKIGYLNGFNRDLIHYVGGIVIPANGQWYLNNSEKYKYTKGSTDGWKLLSDVINGLV